MPRASQSDFQHRPRAATLHYAGLVSTGAVSAAGPAFERNAGERMERARSALRPPSPGRRHHERPGRVRGSRADVADDVGAGRLHPERVTTNVAPFDQAVEAYHEHCRSDAIKTILVAD